MSNSTQTHQTSTDPTDTPGLSNDKGCIVAIAATVSGVLLLCIGLLVISGILFFFRSTLTAARLEVELGENAPAVSEDYALADIGHTEAEVDESVAFRQPSSASPDSPMTGTTFTPDNAELGGTPKLGPITFSLSPTAESNSDESDFSFESGITRIFAGFEYSDLASDSIWTQVWYHNGSEVMSNSQPWLAAKSGVFEHVIEAGGEPIPAGQWALEFYIDDELLSAGSFMIVGEADEAAVAAGEDEPTLDDVPRVYPLVYTKANGDKHDLYVGDTAGSFERFVMRRAAGPSWSPDGRYIFFYGEEGVDQQLENGNIIPLPGVLNGVIKLSASPLPGSVSQLKMFQGYGWNDGTARWADVSPDGSMIAYDGDRGGGRRIYFLGTDANQQFRFEIIGEQSDWSPDSQQIVYRSGRNNQVGIWISNRTDSGHVRITNGGTDSFPAWSPDGETIAFSRDVGGNVDIYIMNVDGTNLQQLTTAPGHDTLPVYLPNGDLVFRSARTGSWGIWKMRGDGSDQVQIIANAPVGADWVYSKMDVLR